MRSTSFPHPGVILQARCAGMESGATSPRVLVVDDDDDVLASLERGLRLSGFDVSTAKDGAEALRSATETRPDAIVLDINMPVLDGVSVVTALRAMDNDVPVCVLKRAACRRPGGRPGGRRRRLPGEAVRAGRAGGAGEGAAAPARLDGDVSSETIQVGPLEVDIPAGGHVVNGTDVDLTKREFDLLAVLAEHKTAVLSRAQLLELVWGYDFAADTNVVDVFIGYLRRKLRSRWRATAAARPRRGVCPEDAVMNLMDRLSRISFARTPSLRTRVAFATAIGAAIVVVIVGTIVWVGITNDRKERLDRRLDEAAGFAIPFLPRGLDEIPRSPNDQDAVITVRSASRSRPTRRRTPGAARRLRRHRRQRRALPGAHRGHPGARADVGGGRRHLRRHHRRHQQPAPPRAGDLCVRHRRGRGAGLAAGRVRGAPLSGWPSRPGRSTPATRHPTSRSAAPARPSRSPTPSRACWNASGRSRTAPRPRWRRRATSLRCRRTSCARR